MEGLLKLLWILWLFARVESKFLVIAPAEIHYNWPEKIHISGIQENGSVEITLHDYPDRTISKSLMNETDVSAGDSTFVTVLVEYDDFAAVQYLTQHRYAYLKVTMTTGTWSVSRESVVRMSSDLAKVMTHTDKGIYAPGEQVRLTVYATDLNNIPLALPVRIDIEEPSGIVMLRLKNTTKTPSNNMEGEISGLLQWSFSLPKYPTTGTWSAKVYYGPVSNKKTLYLHEKTVEFEVANYDLPPFRCQLHDVPDVVILGNMTHFQHSVEARYTFGEPVDGSVVMHYGLDGLKHPFYMVSQSGTLNREGRKSFTLELEKLYEVMRQVDEDFDYKGKHLLMKADCVASVSGRVVHDAAAHTVFSHSPLVFNFDQSPKTFTTLATIFQFQIFHPNGKPAIGETVDVQSNADELTGQTRKNVTTDRQGRGMMIVYPQSMQTSLQFTITSSKMAAPVNYTMKKAAPRRTDIAFDTIRLQYSISENVELRVHVKGGPLRTDLFMLSKGRVMSHRYMESVDGILLETFRLDTMDIGPEVHFLAVCTDRSHRSASAVLTVYVEQQQCTGKVKPQQKEYTLESGNTLARLELDDFPQNSHVVLEMTDQALDALPLQPHEAEEKEKEDCSSEDSQRWTHIGVTLTTDLLPATPLRLPVGPCGRRSRRDADSGTLQELASTCCEAGTSKAADECSLEALRHVLEYDNLDRAAECFHVFTDCCRNASRQNGDAGDVSRSLGTKRRYDINVAVDKAGVRGNYPYGNFPHSKLIGIAAIDAKGSAVQATTLPDTITSWNIRSVSLSRQRGACTADTATLTVKKHVFLKLNLPRVAVRGETLMLAAMVFNYHAGEIEVNISMKGEAGVCSKAPPDKHSEPVVRAIPAKQSVTVQWPIVPLEVGEFPIKVFVVQKNIKLDGTIQAFDAVERVIKIVREGIPKTVYEVRQVNSQASECSGSSDGTTTCHFEMQPVLPFNYVPGSASVKVRMIPNIFGPAVDLLIPYDEINGKTSEAYGTGRHVITTTAMSIYAFDYLSQTESLTAEAEPLFFGTVENGVAKLMAYRKQDGGIGLWRQGDSASTWLTAYALKVYSRGHALSENLDEAVLKGFVDFLFSNQVTQGADTGRFREPGTRGRQSDDGVALTAYVLIALMEADSEVYGQKYQDAVMFLRNNIMPSADGYHVAMIAYALSSSQYAQEAYDTMKTLMIEGVKNDVAIKYFDDLTQSNAIQAASYAVLTAMKNKDIEYCHRIINWLHYQRIHGDGIFTQSQDTIIAMQAITAYEAAKRRPEISLHVTVTGYWVRQEKVLGQFDIAETDRNSELWVDVESSVVEKNFYALVEVQGQGDLQVILETTYNVRQEEGHCRFDVNVSYPVHEDNAYTLNLMGGTKNTDNKDKNDNPGDLPGGGGYPGDDLPGDDYDEDGNVAKEDVFLLATMKEMNLTVCIRHSEAEPVKMAVVKVGMMTGYYPDVEYLKKLVKDGTILQYNARSNGVDLYVYQLTPLETRCISLSALKRAKTYEVSSAAVTVYDFYNPAARCVKAYSSQDDWRPKHLGAKCYEGICSGCYGTSDPSWILSQFNKVLCTPEVTYVLRVKYLNRTQSVDVVRYYVEVMKQYKTGTYTYDKGLVIILEVPAMCPCPDFTSDNVNQFFFVMGNRESRLNGISYVMQMDQKSYVEKWRGRAGIHGTVVNDIKENPCIV